MQRAVQTCCCTYRTCRDPPTAQWLSDVSGVPEMLHSIDGLASWKPWLLELLASPSVEIEVESVLKRHRGISANNPYLQPTAMTYTYTISPPEVAGRVIQTALELAVEWAEDLGVLEAETEALWRERRAIVLDNDEEIKTTLPAFSIDQDGGDDSPFRGGTYDLLQALATRQATKAALASLGASSQKAASFELLKAHWEAHQELFAGDMGKHVGEDYLHKLLELPVTMRSAGKGPRGLDSEEATLSVVDPRAICAELLEWRLLVGAAWIERLASLPEELLDVKREHLRSLSS
jgi:hypothetical protein